MEPSAAISTNNELKEKLVNKEHSNECESSNAKKLKVDDSNVIEEKILPTAVENEENNSSINKKRKYALLIGYCGEGYYGLQRFLS